MPFANVWERDIHFTRHGYKFGAADAFEYERMADSFMFKVMSAATRECVRPTGIDRLRFKETNRHFGVACINPQFVRTFYPVSPVKVTRHGGPVGFFAYECARRDL